MLAKIIIHTDTSAREKGILNILSQNNLKANHPDVLFFNDSEKLGVEQVKKIRDHLKLKPIQSNLKAVCLVSSQNLSLPAQNALLKSLEEPPGEVIFLLGADSESALLPTIISRVEIVLMDHSNMSIPMNSLQQIENLESLNYPQRFQVIESLNDKEDFLHNLIIYYRDKMHQNLKYQQFVEKLLEAEKWAKANVNIRGILEYLMLILPESMK